MVRRRLRRVWVLPPLLAGTGAVVTASVLALFIAAAGAPGLRAPPAALSFDAFAGAMLVGWSALTPLVAGGLAGAAWTAILQGRSRRACDLMLGALLWAAPVVWAIERGWTG